MEEFRNAEEFSVPCNDDAFGSLCLAFDRSSVDGNGINRRKIIGRKEENRGEIDKRDRLLN